jgi:dTDP-4-dehydrorhamnose 3,5-epimerase
MGNIEGVQLTPLRIIENPVGNILHVLKSRDDSFQGFGEAYFSHVNGNSTKGWKKHRQMLLNIVVPVGAIKFYLFDGREESNTYKMTQEVELSVINYQRLTVPPGIWMAFKGIMDGPNMLLNIASIPHDPAEAENLPLINETISYPGFTT